MGAECSRGEASEDAMQLAQMLIDAYARATLHNETWGMATGFLKRRKLNALTMLNRPRAPAPAATEPPPAEEPSEHEQRQKLIADALDVALDGAMCDKRVLAHDHGVVDLPQS